MVEKETCQCDDTLIIENIVRMSRENDIEVEVLMHSGNVVKGIVKAGHGYPVHNIYVRMSSNEGDTHHWINLSEVQTITWTTEKGFLDNLIA